MDSPSVPALRLEGIAKAYGGLEVLREVDLDLPSGTLVHLQGSNGSGKSTLLRIVAGVTAPSAGRVARRPPGVGYVPERFPPALRFTPREYLRHLARIRGRAGEGAPDHLVDRLGLSGFLDVPMAHLSKGTAQKVAVLQALAAQPGMLVLDEAWTGLEASAREALSEAAVARRDAGGVVVFTDHRHRAATLVPDAAYLVADGVLHAGAVEAPAQGDGAGGVLVELAGAVDELSPAELGADVLERHATSVVLRVDAARSDALLGAALGLGLHVVRVERAP
ncbi:MAG TPA: ABC transporter ATP-binding protein [Actinomycetota bacterium]|nr:ABC transporter ATP-binding protein [Actinomycetota bacterium]